MFVPTKLNMCYYQYRNNPNLTVLTKKELTISMDGPTLIIGSSAFKTF